jgi:hypothetical protein
VRVDDGLVTGLYAVRNPEKLAHMQRETALSRRAALPWTPVPFRLAEAAPGGP